MGLFSGNGDQLDETESDTVLPPIRAFEVTLWGMPTPVTIAAHSYDIMAGGALVFAEYVDVGGGKAAIVVAAAYAHGYWKSWKEVTVTPGPTKVQ
jgi:hypothetical protein